VSSHATTRVSEKGEGCRGNVTEESDSVRSHRLKALGQRRKKKISITQTRRNDKRMGSLVNCHNCLMVLIVRRVQENPFLWKRGKTTYEVNEKL